MSRFLWLITSYKKTKACREAIKSLIAGNYLAEGNTLILSDDNCLGPNTKEDSETMMEVFNEFKGDVPDLRLCYNKNPGVRGGVSINKNRGLVQFNKTPEKWDYVILIDDDITISRPGLYEELIEANKADKQDHFTLAWTRQSLWDAFPPRAKSEHLSWHTGSQGSFLFFTRDLIKNLGYYPSYRYFYAYEHSQLSSRALMYQGYCPELYPCLLRTDRYITPQNIPNNYEIPAEKLHSNSPDYWADILRIRQGLDLVNNNPHLPKKGEQLLTNKKK